MSCVTRDIRESVIASIGAYGFFGASLRDDNVCNKSRVHRMRICSPLRCSQIDSNYRQRIEILPELSVEEITVDKIPRGFLYSLYDISFHRARAWKQRNYLRDMCGLFCKSILKKRSVLPNFGIFFLNGTAFLYFGEHLFIHSELQCFCV